MSFSFNWAGTNIQQINPQQSRQAYEDAKNLGTAAMGARKMIGMQKYADLIRNGSGANAGRIAEIKSEIQRLETRNRELQSLMSQNVPAMDATRYQGVQADKQSVADMMARDQELRLQRAAYMMPHGMIKPATSYDMRHPDQMRYHDEELRHMRSRYMTPDGMIPVADDMRLRDEQLRIMRAGYMTPQGISASEMFRLLNTRG